MEKMELLFKTLKGRVDGVDVHELAHILGMEEARDFVSLNRMLNSLVDDNLIFEGEDNRYYDLDTLEIKKGSLIIKRNNSAYIEDEAYGVLEVKENELKGAMNKDVVLYKRNKRTAEIVKILKHNIDCVVGLIRIRQGRVEFYPDDHRLKGFKITNLKQFKLKDRLKVRCIITNYEKKELKLESIIAFLDEPRARELSILFGYNVPMEFTSTALNEARSFNQKIRLEDYPSRKDLTDELIITIDGDDAKDFDDAISISKVDDKYLLKVHIADVSEYVTKNSALDKNAYSRGTSIYYANQVIPMLPFELSNELCSLKPHVNRLAMTVEMLLDDKGNLLDSNFYESVIKSKYRMTYSKVNQIIDGDEALRSEYHELLDMIDDMYALSKILRTKRENGGSIDFNEEEAKLIIKNDKVVDIKLRERGISERIIEDFMIEANVTVASYMKYLDYPMVYRNHDYPKEERILNFIEVLETLGYTFKGNKYQIKAKQLRDCLEYYKGTELEAIVSNLMLRSMAKAKYDNICEGHYGLGLENYCHFTSPIRRYPDLIVHRMLKKYVFKQDRFEDMEVDSKLNHQIAENMSEKERRAINIERDILDLKKAEYMQNKVGKIYDGIISSVLSFGFFVKLDNTVEGLVHVSTLDGRYEFDEKLGVLTCGNKSYSVGQKVTFFFFVFDLRRASVDFTLHKKKRVQRWI